MASTSAYPLAFRRVDDEEIDVFTLDVPVTVTFSAIGYDASNRCLVLSRRLRESVDLKPAVVGQSAGGSDLGHMFA